MSDEPPVVERSGERNERGQFVVGHEKLGGAQKGAISITGLIRQKLQEAPPGQIKMMAELLVEKMLHKAYVDGNEVMIKEIWHYMDGMPKQDLGVSVDKESLPFLTDFFKSLAKPDDGTGQQSVSSSS